MLGFQFTKSGRFVGSAALMRIPADSNKKHGVSGGEFVPHETHAISLQRLF